MIIIGFLKLDEMSLDFASCSPQVLTFSKLKLQVHLSVVAAVSKQVKVVRVSIEIKYFKVAYCVCEVVQVHCRVFYVRYLHVLFLFKSGHFNLKVLVLVATDEFR